MLFCEGLRRRGAVREPVVGLVPELLDPAFVGARGGKFSSDSADAAVAAAARRRATRRGMIVVVVESLGATAGERDCD